MKTLRTVQDLFRLYEAPEVPVKPLRPMFQMVTGADLLEKDITELPMLVAPFLPQNGLAILAGSSDSGKSSLMRQLVTAIVTGQSHFIGFELHTRYQNAIYLATEDDETATANRLHLQNKLSQHHASQLRNLRFVFEYENPLQTLDHLLTEQPADLVVIDVLSDIFSGQLNDAIQVRSFLEDYKKLADKHQTAIIFLHHIGKSAENQAPSKRNLIGSAALEAKCRLVLELRMDPQNIHLRHLCVVKANHLPPQYKSESYVLHCDETTTFHTTGQRQAFDDLAQPSGVHYERQQRRNEDMEKVISLHERGLTRTEISVQTGLSIRTVYSYLQQQGVAGGITQNRRQHVWELYKEGKNAAEIIELTGMSRSTVYNYLNIFREEEEEVSDLVDVEGVDSDELSSDTLFTDQPQLVSLFPETNTPPEPASFKERSTCIPAQSDEDKLLHLFAGYEYRATQRILAEMKHEHGIDESRTRELITDLLAQYRLEEVVFDFPAHDRCYRVR